LYFVVNRSNQPARVACTFRIADRALEIWNPVTGVMREVNEFTVTSNRTVVPLAFRAAGVSVRCVPQDGNAPDACCCRAGAAELPGAIAAADAGRALGHVQFDPRWGGPATMEFATLTDWTEHGEEGIRFYSGTATYRKRFDLNSKLATDQKLFLELGTVKNLAAVRLNGVNLGVVWTAPWQVEITRAVKPADNVLEIDVVNLWPNRLIGDGALPPEKRFTRTNIPLKKNARLLSSGLLGPVTMLSTQP
jgi:hypothetical protein